MEVEWSSQFCEHITEPRIQFSAIRARTTVQLLLVEKSHTWREAVRKPQDSPIVILSHLGRHCLFVDCIPHALFNHLILLAPPSQHGTRGAEEQDILSHGSFGFRMLGGKSAAASGMALPNKGQLVAQALQGHHPNQQSKILLVNLRFSKGAL